MKLVDLFLKNRTVSHFYYPLDKKCTNSKRYMRTFKKKSMYAHVLP